MGGGHFQEFEDEYLETLYEFYERFPDQRVRNGDLAKYLDVSPASATEMVQRLAKNGFVDYVPYKGASLTPKGLEHGMMMKRRHRLAEVLLTMLPFEGDVHETACRLEHAFDDDLEVCISLLLGNPTVDPSGREIPPPNSRISHKLENQSDLVFLNNLSVNQSGEIVVIMTSPEHNNLLGEAGISVGKIVSKTDSSYTCDGDVMQISEDLSRRIILRCQREE
jgi:DtxR family transcriptional regulator, Mn-dependent transcriptional regulator